MQYVNCLYSAQGDYICQKNERLDAFYDKPIVEGFEGGLVQRGLAQEKSDQKIDESYKNVVKYCAPDTTTVNAKLCIDNLATFHNTKCKKTDFCSPLTKCVQTRQNAYTTCKVKQCTDPVFTKAMIEDGTNYTTKKTVIPKLSDMPSRCSK